MNALSVYLPKRALLRCSRVEERRKKGGRKAEGNYALHDSKCNGNLLERENMHYPILQLTIAYTTTNALEFFPTADTRVSSPHVIKSSQIMEKERKGRMKTR